VYKLALAYSAHPRACNAANGLASPRLSARPWPDRSSKRAERSAHSQEAPRRFKNLSVELGILAKKPNAKAQDVNVELESSASSSGAQHTFKIQEAQRRANELSVELIILAKKLNAEAQDFNVELESSAST
jgi:hypothetical protein